MGTERPETGADFTCESVKEKLLCGEELNKDEQNHLLSCESCRTYSEEIKTMLADLENIGKESENLEKDGVSLADSVMKEVNVRKFFGNTEKKGGFSAWTKHFGLVAACIVLLIMALPFIRNQKLENRADTASVVSDGDISPSPDADLQYDGVQNDASESDIVEYSVSESASGESADEEESDKTAESKPIYEIKSVKVIPPAAKGAAESENDILSDGAQVPETNFAADEGADKESLSDGGVKISNSSINVRTTPTKGTDEYKAIKKEAIERCAEAGIQVVIIMFEETGENEVTAFLKTQNGEVTMIFELNESGEWQYSDKNPEVISEK